MLDDIISVFLGLPPPENAMIALSRRFRRHFALWPLTGETNYEGGEEDFMIMFEETEILSLSLSTIPHTVMINKVLRSNTYLK